MSEPVQYGGWQSERIGFIGRLSGPGFALVVAAFVLMLIPLQLRSWSGGAAATPIAAALVALAYGRVLGLSADEWISLYVRHQMAVATGRNTFVSGVHAPATSDGKQPLDLPGVLARLRILEAPDGAGGQLGVVHDPVEGTYAAVLRISVPGLALVDTDRQNSRVASWGAFLRSQCIEGGPITRIAVHQRTLPDDGTALRVWTARHTDPDAPVEAVAALEELIDRAGPSATTRETYLTVTLSASRARPAIRSAGGGQIGAAAVLVRELHAMTNGLASAGLAVDQVLTPRDLAAAIRTAYDPSAQPMVAARAAAADDPDWRGAAPGIEPSLAGPAAAETGWGSYRHDGAVTASFQIRTWPQSQVYATFLQPLLRPRPTARRSMTLLYEPLGPGKARSELSKERTKRDAARRLRAKTGRPESLDERKEATRAASQDAARAAGHGIVRMTAMVAVTVTDPEQLEVACAELQADASAAGLELRRMWGSQDAGFAAAALPLGRGLPERRVSI